MSRVFTTRPLTVEAELAGKDHQFDQHTPDGVTVATCPKGWWLIRDQQGVMHACPPDIFDGVFQAADGGSLFDETGPTGGSEDETDLGVGDEPSETEVIE